MKPGIRRATALLVFGFVVAWICWLASWAGGTNPWATSGLIFATLLELAGFVVLVRAERPARKPEA